MKIERYRQIASELQAELQSGKYEKGDVFPVRSELAKRFKTTRSTVNRAMEELINKGFLAARRGAGTVVVSSEGSLKIAYIASEWLMHYMPRAADCELIYFSYEEIFNSRSAINVLNRFDGILWSHPDEKNIPKLEAVAGKIPSVLVNRISDKVRYVVSEYIDSFSEYVSERLAGHPDSTPYFLSSRESGDPYRKRYEGFVKACRKHQRFYENIEMPEDFAAKELQLENKLAVGEKELLIFSDNWAHTGAVVSWGNRHKRRFGKDIFYTDFDNNEPAHVWGIKTTSFIQDFDCLTRTAFNALLAVMKKGGRPKNVFLAPELRNGDT